MDASYNARHSYQGSLLLMSRNQRLIVIVGIAISAIFLWLAFQGLNPAAVWSYIQQADVVPLLLAAVWFFVSVFFMALRWQYLLRSIRPVSVWQLVQLVCIGYMGNNVYPLRTGEVLRVYLLQRNQRVPFARGMVVAVAERLFDGLVMLTFILVALSLLHIENAALQSIVSVGTPVFLIGLALFFLLAARPNILRKLIAVVTKPLPGRLREIATSLSEDVLQSLEGFRRPTDLAGTVLWSYVSWILHSGVYWVVALAFGLRLDFATTLLVVGAVNLAGLIPASPGQVGVFEFFVVVVLTSVGVPEVQATAYALVVHLVIWLPVTLVGFILLARQGLSISAVTHARELENKAATS
jgi:uncharacterized protein (TIRG00374 family)